MNDRVFENFDGPLVDQLKKLKFIDGDISIDNLNLDITDQDELKKNVNIFFHCAATISFNGKLKQTVNTNTAGIKRCLEFAKEIKNLQSFVHMSTTFSHCYRNDLAEKYYTTSLDPLDIIKKINGFGGEALADLGSDL